MNQKGIEKTIKDLLRVLELEGPNFDETPERVARFYLTLREPDGIKLTTFPLEHKGGMIVLKNHVSYGMCPHHLLPVKYIFKIGYLPEDKVLGLSKLARLADFHLSDLPLQEDIPARIGIDVASCIKPKGVGVVLQGEHMCTRIRGVRSPCAEAVSTFMWGIFLEDSKARMEFLAL